MLKSKFTEGDEVYFIPTEEQLKVHSKISREYNKGIVNKVSEYPILKDNTTDCVIEKKGIWYSIFHSRFRGLELFNIPETSMYSLEELRNEEGELIVDLPDLL